MSPPHVPPPDPHPKKPTLKCPPGAVDSHIHIFGPASKYPYGPKTWYIPPDALPETHLKLQDTLGLSRAVAVSGGAYGMDYKRLEDTLVQYPKRFRGVALLADETPTEEIARLDKLGVCGVRFVSPNIGSGLPPLSRKLADRVADFGWHIQVFLHGTELLDVGDDLLKYPNTIVFDHMAMVNPALGLDQPVFKKLLQMLDGDRCWLKLSGPMLVNRKDEPPYPTVTPMARKLVEHAPDRLVWGTDWPHVNLQGRIMPNDGDLLGLMLEWAPDENVRNRILAANPAKLYGFT
jgi:predicted TIM-barrel fold metal-dependent hydrolase